MVDKQPNKSDIRNARYYGQRGKGGVIGIKYEKVGKVTNQSDDDWKRFIRSTGKLTRTGQLLLQKTTEAYVYSVLGAQARTHWTIVGAGARSLQTQEIFAKIVQDTISQDDDSILVSNMRTAIKNTNVVTLISSKMIILKEPFPGFNNVLTLATKNMKFGKNDKVNFFEAKGNIEEESSEDPDMQKRSEEEESQNTQKSTTKLRTQKKTVIAELPSTATLPNDKHEEGLVAVFGAILTLGAIFTKFLI